MDPWNWFQRKVKQDIPHQDTHDTRLSDQEPVTLQKVKGKLRDIDDAAFREIKLPDADAIQLVYIKSLVNKLTLQEMVLEPIQTQKPSLSELSSWFEKVDTDKLPQLMADLLRGHTILFVSGADLVLKADTVSPPQRAITTSETETSVHGPQDSFTESLDTNLSLVKKRVATPKLKQKMLTLGTESPISVSVMYMEDIAHHENVQRVFTRLKNLEFAGFVGLSQLKQMIEDNPYSPFPQFGLTHRPDTAVIALLDGRIVIMMNGAPEAITCPTSFLEFFNSPDDFYMQWWTATLLRSLRFFGFLLSVLLTSTYVSLLTFHPEMLPPRLLTVLAESRAKVPFPPMVEAIVMELIVEVLREAAVRMPTKIGVTIGIVGGIVIGTAAVEAGLASNVLIVLIAVTALLSFLPNSFLMANALRIIRYPFILAAGILGIYGQMLALAFLFAHLCNLTSLGTPYMTPGFPRKWTDAANSIIRAPYRYFVARSGMARAKKQLTRPLDEE